jgi:UbiD family decarboxylase
MASGKNERGYVVVEPGSAHPLGWNVPPIDDLRSAIEFLKRFPGEYLETDREVDPNAELAGVYRYIGAGGTVMRPTRIGPAMMFNTVKNFPGARVLVGLLASRRRVSHLLGAPMRELGAQMAQARKTVTPPVSVSADAAPCQEVVYRADEPGFDLRKLLPAPTNTPEDAGPYFCMGLVLGSDPANRDDVDVTIHRLCVQSACSKMFTRTAPEAGSSSPSSRSPSAVQRTMEIPNRLRS